MRLYNENHQADVGEWIDEDLMITWFANAIMAGHDVAIDRLKDLILSGRPKKKECVCDAMTLECWGCECGARVFNIACDKYDNWIKELL